MARQRARGGSEGYRRIVAKFGTNLLTAESDELDARVMGALVEQAARLIGEGRQVVLVTSGAIAAGRHRLKAHDKRREIPFRQVMASVGQGPLMQQSARVFAPPAA